MAFETVVSITASAMDGQAFLDLGIMYSVGRSVPVDRTLTDGAVVCGSGAHHVQRHGRANKSLQCLLVNLLALVEIDGTSRVAIEAGVEEA